MSFKDVLLPIMQSEEAAEAHFRQHLCIRRTPPGEGTDFAQVLTHSAHCSKGRTELKFENANFGFNASI